MNTLRSVDDFLSDANNLNTTVSFNIFSFNKYTGQKKKKKVNWKMTNQ